MPIEHHRLLFSIASTPLPIKRAVMPPLPSSGVCNRCSYRLQWQRGFSSSSQRLAVPPENPRWIHVPEHVQAPKYEPKKPVKGILPVARDIFDLKKKRSKADAKWERKFNVPEPLPREAPHGPEADRILYDRQMSLVRRQTLREGMTELRSRMRKTSDRLGTSSGFKQMRNQRAATAPPPLDEILTNPTIHISARMLMATGNAPGPKKRGRSHVPQHEAKRSQARQAALHNLYVHAQHFIVNEAQLNDELDKVFGSDEFPLRWNEANSVWALPDKPRTAADMLSIEKKGMGTVSDDGAYGRMKQLAEELTGGKMSQLKGPGKDRFR